MDKLKSSFIPWINAENFETSILSIKVSIAMRDGAP